MTQDLKKWFKAKTIIRFEPVIRKKDLRRLAVLKTKELEKFLGHVPYSDLFKGELKVWRSIAQATRPEKKREEK